MTLWRYRNYLCTAAVRTRTSKKREKRRRECTTLKFASDSQRQERNTSWQIPTLFCLYRWLCVKFARSDEVKHRRLLYPFNWCHWWNVAFQWLFLTNEEEIWLWCVKYAFLLSDFPSVCHFTQFITLSVSWATTGNPPVSRRASTVQKCSATSCGKGV